MINITFLSLTISTSLVLYYYFCHQTSLPVLDNPLSTRLNEIIRLIQNQRQHYLKVRLQLLRLFVKFIRDGRL